MSRLSKICLLVITLCLAIIALHSVMRPQHARAANHYKYVVGEANWQQGEQIQDELNKCAAEGWELVAPVYAQGPTVHLIFRQEAR
jgi:hypothetical protein